MSEALDTGYAVVPFYEEEMMRFIFIMLSAHQPQIKLC